MAGATNQCEITGTLMYGWDGTNAYPIKVDSTGRIASERIVSKTAASPMASQNLFTFTGSIRIDAIIGTVITGVENVANNCKLTITPDALGAYDICGDLNIQAFDAGSLLSITGTAANALVGTDAGGSIAPGQANPVFTTCITSGVISTVMSHAGGPTGVIRWDILWTPLSVGATLVAN